MSACCLNNTELPVVPPLKGCLLHLLHMACPLPAAAETHAAFTGAIVSLCLGGPAVMVFRRDGHAPRALFLPPRSLVVMAGVTAVGGCYAAAYACTVACDVQFVAATPQPLPPQAAAAAVLQAVLLLQCTTPYNPWPQMRRGMPGSTTSRTASLI